MVEQIKKAIYSYLIQDGCDANMTLQEGSFPTYDQIKNSEFVKLELEQLPEEQRDSSFTVAFESLVWEKVLLSVEGYEDFYERASGLESELFARSYARAIEENDF